MSPLAQVAMAYINACYGETSEHNLVEVIEVVERVGTALFQYQHSIKAAQAR